MFHFICARCYTFLRWTWDLVSLNAMSISTTSFSLSPSLGYLRASMEYVRYATRHIQIRERLDRI